MAKLTERRGPSSSGSKTERLKRQERELREQITDFSAADWRSRDAAHDRERMTPPHFLGTNILHYPLSRDPSKAAKRERAA